MTKIVKGLQKDHKNHDFYNPFTQIAKNTLKKEIIINKIFCNFDFKSLPEKRQYIYQILFVEKLSLMN